MPNPFPYTAKSGVVTWKVRFRYQGRNCQETFDTRNDAQTFCNDIANHDAAEALRRLSDVTASGPTLDVLADHHIATRTSVTEGTRLAYRRMYARVWQPRLGATRVDQLTSAAIRKALADYAATTSGKGKSRGPVSDKTIRNAWGLLAGICRTAVADGYLDRSPCAGVKLPRRTEHTRVEQRFLTLDELRRLFDAMPAHYRPLVLFLAGTSCRWGEAVALDVRDVDLAAATVRITKSEKYDPSKAKWEIGPTKTRKSRRTVTLPAEVVDIIAPLAQGRAGTERLFTAPRGGSIRHRRFWGDVWLPACKAAGLEPRPRIHDLRHSGVAWLIAAGVPLPVIQARLGHEHITTTIDTYGHLLPDLQRAAAQAASVALGGVSSSSGDLPSGSTIAHLPAPPSHGQA